MAAHDYEQQRRCPRVRVPFVGHRLWRSRWRDAEAITSCLVRSQILYGVRLWIGDLRLKHRKALVPVHLVHNLEQSLLHRQRLLLLLADVVLVPFFRKGLHIADWAASVEAETEEQNVAARNVGRRRTPGRIAPRLSGASLAEPSGSRS